MVANLSLHPPQPIISSQTNATGSYNQISPPTKVFTANQIHRITEVVNIFNLVLTFRDEPKQCIFCKTQVSCANGGDSDNDDVEDGDGFDVHNHSSLTS